MPTKTKPKGTSTKTKTKTKVQIKTGTLVALSWAVAFAAMGLAASGSSSPTTKHLIGSFIEKNNQVVSTYIRSRKPRKVISHLVDSGKLNFSVQSSSRSRTPIASKRYAFRVIKYNQTNPPRGTTPPSYNTIKSMIPKLKWDKNSTFNWNLRQPGAQESNIVDFIAFTGAVKNTRYTSGNRIYTRKSTVVDDYAVIRLKINPLAQEIPIVDNPTVPIDFNASSTIDVVENNAFADRSATNPTGVAGSQNVKIASFIIQGDSFQDADITQIVLRDPTGAVTELGDDFQNLKLMHENTQVGVTMGSLNTNPSSNAYTFNPSPAIRVSKDQSYIVDVYADIKHQPEHVNTPISPVLYVGNVIATGFDTGTDVSHGNQVNLQDAYILEGGSLRVFTDPNTPVSQQIVMGSTRVDMAKFKFSAWVGEDIAINSIAISDELSATATSTLRNLRLMDSNGSQIGSTLGSLDSNGYARFTNLNLTIPEGQSKTITVQSDITTYLDSGVITTGQTHRLFLHAGDYDAMTSGQQMSVNAVGVNSGNTIIEDALIFNPTGSVDINQYANTMTIHRTKLGAAWASDTPNGASTGGQEQIIGKIVISNTANSGSYDATLESLDANFSTLGFSNGITERRVAFYKDTVQSSNLISETFFDDISSRSFSTNNAGNFDETYISAGSSKTLIITMDTSDAGQNEILSVGVGPDQIAWSDGSAENITTVENLPLLHRTLRY